jgi:hypothetical protein
MVPLELLPRSRRQIPVESTTESRFTLGPHDEALLFSSLEPEQLAGRK